MEFAKRLEAEVFGLEDALSKGQSRTASRRA